MKKILLIIALIICVILTIVITLIKNDIIIPNNARLTQYNLREKFCTLIGGTMAEFSFGSRCEPTAKDANKTCVYDNECSMNLCIYKYTSDNASRPSTEHGRCKQYADQMMSACHRPKGGNVYCDLSDITT